MSHTLVTELSDFRPIANESGALSFTLTLALREKDTAEVKRAYNIKRCRVFRNKHNVLRVIPPMSRAANRGWFHNVEWTEQIEMDLAAMIEASPIIELVGPYQPRGRKRSFDGIELPTLSPLLMPPAMPEKITREV